jgi:hypothetical protein
MENITMAICGNCGCVVENDEELCEECRGEESGLSTFDVIECFDDLGGVEEIEIFSEENRMASGSLFLDSYEHNEGVWMG